MLLQYQASVPKPNNPDVWVVEIDEGTAYVSQFGGYLIDDVTISLKAKALKEDLTANKEAFDDSEAAFLAPCIWLTCSSRCMPAPPRADNGFAACAQHHGCTHLVYNELAR